MASKEELEKLKVTDLKQMCKDKGLSQSGVKADLVERLASAEAKPAEEQEKTQPAADEEAKPAEADASKAEEAKTEEPKEEAAEGDAEVKKEEEDEAQEESKEESKEEADAEMKETKEEEEADTKESAPVQEERKVVEEEDAPEDSRPKVKAEDIYINPADCTPNAMPSDDGKLLMTMCAGGMQYLFAGARCSVGIKSGRYMFEVKIVESLTPAEGRNQQVRTPQPKQLVRVGFSTAGPPALLDDGADKAFFDSDGNFIQNRKRVRASSHFKAQQWVGCLLNLDASTPNANTMTLYSGGRRISDIMPLPEALIGKVLYPTVTYKNVTLQVNFGPAPKVDLPFKCRLLQDAAAEDVEIATARKEGKNEVLFPIGLPDEGVFDWLDGFLEKNPSYLELSDRKVLEWARKSLLFRQSRQQVPQNRSNDKPGMSFGINFMDDNSVQTTLTALAPALRRDFIVMELASNLLASERKAALKRFPSADFKRIAVVAMGEPPEEFKSKAQELLLAEKVQKAEREKQERDESKAKRARYGEGYGETKAPDAPAETEGEKTEEGDAEKKDSAEGDEDKPVELTEEEKKLWWYKRETPDLSPYTLAKNFASFTLPDAEEGFDEIRFEWQDKEKASAHMKEWMMTQKKTQRAEDLEPSDWFKEKHSEWGKVLQDWRKKQQQWRDEARRKPKKEKKEEKKEEKKDEAEEKKDGEEAAEKKEEDEEKEEKKEEDEKKEDEEDADEEPDVDSVKDILDIGGGKPLFSEFAYEDWVLLGLRYELHLLVHAFKKDLDDPDRPGFSESHLAFYYNKYYKKAFNVKWFNVENLAALVEHIKDTITIHSETAFLQAENDMETPLDKFVRLTEENRRERQRCIDAGDETANLKFNRPAPPPARGHDNSARGMDRRSDRRAPPVGSNRDGGGSRGGPRGGPPPRSSYQDRGGDRGRKGGSDRGYGPPPSSRGGDYGSAKGGHKRPYGGGGPPPPAPYPQSKQPRYDHRGGGGPQRSSYPPPPPYSSGQRRR